MSILCLKISTPLTPCTFSKLTPQNKPVSKTVPPPHQPPPPRDVINDRSLRKALLEYLQWLRAIKKRPTFRKVIETQREFEDTEGFDWLESTEPAQFLVCNHLTSSHVGGQY